MIKLIVASTSDHLIGNNEKMPWHCPEELKFFKQMTMGHTLLWGRKTFVNLPKKLAGRQHFVITTAQYVENADEVLHDTKAINKLFKKFRHSKKTLFICGGKSIYEQFYQQASEIYWTEITTPAQGNVYLHLDLSKYKKSVFLEKPSFKVFLYQKKVCKIRFW